MAKKKGETHYEVLGVSEGATADEIRSAYRKLARDWHPDICKKKNAEKKFKQIKTANETLSDESKRQQYDAELRISRQPSVPRDAIDDGISQAMDMMSDMVEEVFGAPTKRKHQQRGREASVDPLPRGFDDDDLGGIL